MLSERTTISSSTLYLTGGGAKARPSINDQGSNIGGRTTGGRCCCYLREYLPRTGPANNFGENPMSSWAQQSRGPSNGVAGYPADKCGGAQSHTGPWPSVFRSFTMEKGQRGPAGSCYGISHTHTHRLFSSCGRGCLPLWEPPTTDRSQDAGRSPTPAGPAVQTPNYP